MSLDAPPPDHQGPNSREAHTATKMRPQMFYEIRRYQARPQRRDEWVRYMEQVVIPFQEANGMTVTASFVDEEDPDGYVWIRRFDNEAQRAALYTATYDSDRWKNEIAPAVTELLLLDQSVITRVVPTTTSALR